MITVNNLTKIFTLDQENITAFENVSFKVNKGEFFTVIGPSGCGKSTLLRVIANLDNPTSGEIIWEEKPNIAFVFQNFALFPFMTVFENIEFCLKMRGVDRKKRQEIVKELIKEVDLEDFSNKHPKELSGGMKQRVGIARSLAIDPNILLLDEPFSSLDEFTAQTLRNLLLDIWQKRKITIILVTHLVREALQLADRICVMTPAPGRVKTIITSSLKRPRNEREKEFFAFEDKLIELIRK